MADHLKLALVVVAYAAACISGLTGILAIASIAFSQTVFLAVAYGSAGVLLVFFLAAILDPATQYAVAAANSEMQGDRPFRFRFISLSDRKWGLFGEKFGRGFLPVLRSVLFAAFVVALLLTPKGQQLGDARPLVLTLVGFWITVLLTMDQLRAHYPRAKDQ